MKKSSIRSPEPGPFGLTRREARAGAMVRASFVNSPRGGSVDTAVTPRTQRRPCLRAVRTGRRPRFTPALVDIV